MKFLISSLENELKIDLICILFKLLDISGFMTKM